LYTVGSIACTIAPDYGFLIAARVIQGMTAGVGVVIGRAGDPRSLRGAARAEAHGRDHDDLQHRAGHRADHRRLGARRVRLARGVRRHGCCGVLFATSAWWKLPETHAPANRIPFNARNLVSTVVTVLRHPGIPHARRSRRRSTSARCACFIGAAPRDHREALAPRARPRTGICSCR
jgi:DHA1 family bicyclomycin/chloramphenicol resistance-like MFS transporter